MENQKNMAGGECLSGGVVSTDVHWSFERYAGLPQPPGKRIEVSAWKNDKALAEVVLRSYDLPVRGITVRAGAFLSNGAALDPRGIRAVFMGRTLGYRGDAGYSTPDKTVPQGDRTAVFDILDLSDREVQLEANEIQPIWLEFSIPAGARPGTYCGQIIVEARQPAARLVFDCAVEVLDMQLPDPADFRFDLEFWQFPYRAAQYYGVEPFSPEHLQILRPQMSKYKEVGGHAITASIAEEPWNGSTYGRYPSMIRWARGADGAFRFDYAHFDAWVQFCQELGIGDKIVCYSIIPWGNRLRFFDQAAQCEATLTLAPGTEQYNEVWGAFLAALAQHLDERGWFDRVYMGIDEREDMALAFDLLDTIRNRDGHTFKKSAAMGHFNASLLEVIRRADTVSVSSMAAKPELELYKKMAAGRAGGAREYRTNIYTCTEHFPNSFVWSMPAESYWTILFSASLGATGFLRWAYDAWVEDPLRDTTHCAFEAGDCFLIYPDRPGSPAPQCRSSVRLEKLAQGVRDVNKLLLLKEKSAALKAAVCELLRGIKPDYPGVKNGLGAHGGATWPTPETQSSLPRDMQAVRRRLRELTLQWLNGQV